MRHRCVDIFWLNTNVGVWFRTWIAGEKASTLATDRSRISAHILPKLGHLKVKAVKRADVQSFMEDIASGKESRRVKLDKPRAVSNIRGGKGAASRTIGLLGAIFTYAEKRDLITANPVRGVTRFADGQRSRRLSDSEYADLGKALTAATQPPAPRQPGAPRRVREVRGRHQTQRGAPPDHQGKSS